MADAQRDNFTRVTYVCHDDWPLPLLAPALQVGHLCAWLISLETNNPSPGGDFLACEGLRRISEARQVKYVREGTVHGPANNSATLLKSFNC